MNQHQRLYQPILTIFLAITFSYSCQKKGTSPSGKTESFELSATYTESTYQIQIYYPPGYTKSQDYHVIYLLDGDQYFAEASEVLEKYESTNKVIVAIGYASQNNRGTDYSFPADEDFPQASGGAKDFFKFISQELIPLVESEKGIQSKSRMLYGHSLGGFFTLYCLFEQEFAKTFQSFIAASPNLMWSNAYLFQLENDFFSADNELDVNLYLSVGDIEGASINLYFDAFVQQLNNHDYNGLNLITERLENTAHRNSPIQSFEHGLSLFNE